MRETNASTKELSTSMEEPGAICVRIYFAFMVMVGVCSTCPILVKNNPKFGVPKLIRLKVICN